MTCFFAYFILFGNFILSGKDWLTGTKNLNNYLSHCFTQVYTTTVIPIIFFTVDITIARYFKENFYMI